jgi:hypothetical protein
LQVEPELRVAAVVLRNPRSDLGGEWAFFPDDIDDECGWQSVDLPAPQASF